LRVGRTKLGEDRLARRHRRLVKHRLIVKHLCGLPRDATQHLRCWCRATSA
jgi:hypothetical protein